MGPTEAHDQPQIHFCFVCNGPGTTRHHLIPKSTHYTMRGNTYFWRKTVRACSKCHVAIHYYFSCWELAHRYNTEYLLKKELKRRQQG